MGAASLVGFIPACAGSTYCCRVHWLYRKVHPRMRGVHSNVCQKATRNTGSSPHARGPRHVRQETSGEYRFIPACAGSTNPGENLQRTAQVHPRMRGVHTTVSRGYRTTTGSSPHARGPHHASFLALALSRFIPACAGSTQRGMPVHIM